MRTLIYPRTQADASEVLGQHTFDLAHAQLMSWRQAPGAYGNLHLHSCWGESSVLRRRYHGQTAATAYTLLQGFRALFDRTNDIRWRLLADDVVANVLFLQAPSGGFYHASGEFEPTYTPEQSCPIHQGLPLLALLLYADWSAADPARRELIRPAIDAHWQWFSAYWNRRGNAWRKPLPFPGFCGVTNQDLVIVAALARYAQVYSDASRYELYGLPVLETYLGSSYYHEAIGFFERGDQANFVERTGYYAVIIPMLQQIHAIFPDKRIPAIIDNVCRQLLDSLHTGADGLTHFPWGAQTDSQDKRCITQWIRTPHTFTSYPELLPILTDYVQRCPDTRNRELCTSLERTLAAYVFADGTVPAALGGKEPLFAIVSRPEPLWLYLIHRLGPQLSAPRPISLPMIRRICGSVEFRCNAKGWAIYQADERKFAGLKADACAVGLGNEDIAGLDATIFDQADIQETVALLSSPQ